MGEQPQHTLVTITPRTMIIGILLVLLVAVLFYLRDLVLILLTAIVIASAIEPAAKWFMRRKIPRTLSVLLVYTIVLLFLFCIVYFFLPPLVNEATGFLSTLPDYVESIDITNVGGQTSVSDITGTIVSGDIINELRSVLSNISGSVWSTLSAIFGGLLSFILIIVFSFYFAVVETSVEDFLRVVTPNKYQDYVANLWRRSQYKIGLWMQGQLVLAIIIGMLVYLGLTILGVRYALLLAIVAALFELIPVFGPILAAIPAVIIGFVDGGATVGLLVIGLYLIIQQFENHLIYPLVVKKVVGVPALLVILALIVGAQLAGFLGILLSVPVAAAIQELVSDIQKGKRLRLEQETSTPKA